MSSSYFAQLKPVPGQVASRTLTLRLDHLPGTRALQAKGAPRVVRWDVFGAHLEREQIGYDRHGHRAFHPVDLFGDLMLAHTYHSLQSFTNSSTHHRRRYTPTISRAVTGSGRWVTSLLVCCGPSWRRRLLRTTVTSPRWRSRARLT